MAQPIKMTPAQLPIPETLAKETRQFFFPLYFLPSLVCFASAAWFEFGRHYTVGVVDFLGATIFCIFGALYTCRDVNKTIKLYEKAYQNWQDTRDAPLTTPPD